MVEGNCSSQLPSCLSACILITTYLGPLSCLVNIGVVWLNMNSVLQIAFSVFMTTINKLHNNKQCSDILLLPVINNCLSFISIIKLHTTSSSTGMLQIHKLMVNQLPVGLIGHCKGITVDMFKPEFFQAVVNCSCLLSYIDNCNGL